MHAPTMSVAADCDHLLIIRKNSAGSGRPTSLSAFVFEALLRLVVPLEGGEIDAPKSLLVTTPCCLSCFARQAAMPTREYYVREIFPRDSVVLLQSLDDGDGDGAPASLAAQVMDAKCTYWNVGRESDALLQHARRVSAATARFHAGNLWEALIAQRDSAREKIVDMSHLHLRHCERCAANAEAEPDPALAVCMKTLRILPCKLARCKIHKDINELRRRWSPDAALRFCS
jgi:hypothetical protein